MQFKQKGLLSAFVGNGTYVSFDATAEPVLLCGKNDSHIEGVNRLKELLYQ